MNRFFVSLLLTFLGSALLAVPRPAGRVVQPRPAVFTPRIDLKVTPREVYVTRSAEAEISFLLPFRMRGSPSIEGDFIPERTRLQLRTENVTLNGTNFYRYSTVVPLPAVEPGVKTIGPAVVGIPQQRRSRSPFDGFFGGSPFEDDDFFGGMFTQRVRFESNRVTYRVKTPPEEGRPASDIGAIADDLSVKCRLDTNVCTAGDPVLCSVEISGTMDFARVKAPEPPKSEVFRPDPTSLRTETLAGSKRFTWRLRALKAATTEFPSCEVSWFDPAKEVWRTVRTEPIPVQVRAGVQAALGAVDEAGEADVFPMPDGIDLDFPQDDFTLQHAVALASRAVTEKDFLSAADTYARYLGNMKSFPDGGFGFLLRAISGPLRSDGPLHAKHCANVGALYVMAGKPAEALRYFRRAEWLVGADESSVRGVKAAFARQKNDPRAELPLPRQFFPFYFALPLWGRILVGFGVLAALSLVLFLLGRMGRKGPSFVFAVLAAGAASAEGTVRLEPSAIAVGQPAAIVFTFRTAEGERADSLQFGGLPDASEGIEYGEIETMSDNTFRLPVRFLVPYSNTIHVVARGMLTRTVRRPGFTSSSSHNFADRFSPLVLNVKPLPQQGRPLDFTGAIGDRFKLGLTLSPSAVRPGDLVTATYALSFEGYCPSNVFPRVEHLSREFKLYAPKETARTRSSVTWTQMLVPRSAAATNAALVTFNYYDIREKRYRIVRAPGVALRFLSQEAASTENTAVLVNSETASQSGAEASAGRRSDASSSPLRLRFAPSDVSPVIAVFPPGTPMRVLMETKTGWRRIVTSRAVGWTR